MQGKHNYLYFLCVLFLFLYLFVCCCFCCCFLLFFVVFVVVCCCFCCFFDLFRFVFVFVICFCLLYEIDREKNTNFQTQIKYFGNSHEIKLSFFTDLTNNILPRLTTTVITTRLSVLTTNYTRQINVLSED